MFLGGSGWRCNLGQKLKVLLHTVDLQLAHLPVVVFVLCVVQVASRSLLVKISFEDECSLPSGSGSRRINESIIANIIIIIVVVAAILAFNVAALVKLELFLCEWMTRVHAHALMEHLGVLILVTIRVQCLV